MNRVRCGMSGCDSEFVSAEIISADATYQCSKHNRVDTLVPTLANDADSAPPVELEPGRYVPRIRVNAKGGAYERIQAELSRFRASTRETPAFVDRSPLPPRVDDSTDSVHLLMAAMHDTTRTEHVPNFTTQSSATRVNYEPWVTSQPSVPRNPNILRVDSNMVCLLGRHKIRAAKEAEHRHLRDHSDRLYLGWEDDLFLNLTKIDEKKLGLWDDNPFLQNPRFFPRVPDLKTWLLRYQVQTIVSFASAVEPTPLRTLTAWQPHGSVAWAPRRKPRKQERWPDSYNVMQPAFEHVPQPAGSDFRTWVNANIPAWTEYDFSAWLGFHTIWYTGRADIIGVELDHNWVRIKESAEQGSIAGKNVVRSTPLGNTTFDKSVLCTRRDVVIDENLKRLCRPAAEKLAAAWQKLYSSMDQLKDQRAHSDVPWSRLEVESGIYRDRIQNARRISGRYKIQRNQTVATD